METPTRSRLDALRQVTAAVDRWRGDDRATTADELVAEEPLEVRARARVDARASVETIAVIMRTPGHDDELAAGFLFSEGLLRARDELAELVPGADPDGLPSDNVMDVVAAPGVDIVARMREAGYSRQFAVNASCGVCGKNSVAAACATLPPLPLGGLTVDHDILYGLPDRLRAEQRVFAHTGGLHAAGIFDRAGNLLALREDVGRHNAVDKLVGRALLDGTLPMDERILLRERPALVRDRAESPRRRHPHRRRRLRAIQPGGGYGAGGRRDADRIPARRHCQRLHTPRTRPLTGEAIAAACSPSV